MQRVLKAKTRELRRLRRQALWLLCTTFTTFDFILIWIHAEFKKQTNIFFLQDNQNAQNEVWCLHLFIYFFVAPLISIIQTLACIDHLPSSRFTTGRYGESAPSAGSIGAVQGWRDIFARKHDSRLSQPCRLVYDCSLHNSWIVVINVCGHIENNAIMYIWILFVFLLLVLF